MHVRDISPYTSVPRTRCALRGSGASRLYYWSIELPNVEIHYQLEIRRETVTGSIWPVKSLLRICYHLFSACAMHPAVIIGTVRSLWIVDLAMGQIPRSRERIYSCS